MDFSNSSIIVIFISAVVAFIFNLLIERIKLSMDARIESERNRKLVLMTLKATKAILSTINQKYRDSDFFDYVYLGQLEAISSKLDEFRFKEPFLQRTSDQSDYFDVVSKINLLTASMRSIENYKASSSDGGNEAEKKEFIRKNQSALIADLLNITAKIESISNKLEL